MKSSANKRHTGGNSMNRKLMIAAAGLMLMCGGLLAGCSDSSALTTSDAAGKDKVTINVKVPVILLNPDFDEEVQTSYDFLVKAAAAFTEEYKDADVTVNVVEVDQAEVTSIADATDSEAAADVLYGDYFSNESYVYTGRVVPLDDIITDDIRTDIDETFWQASTMDGRVYMMPFLYRQNVLGYNKEMFRACGLEKYCSDREEVQTWTMDEWAEILAALKAQLPENNYALMMYAGNNQGDTHIMSFIRSMGSGFFDEDGRFNINTPEGIAGLQWIKDLQLAGYIPPNADKLVIVDNNDLFVNRQLAIYIVNDATEVNQEFDLGFVNFPSVNGGISTNFNSGFQVFDNGDEAKLKAAKEFVRYIYESDFIDYSEGSIPCSSKVAAKYKDELKSVQKYLDNAATGVHFTGGNPNWMGVRAAFYPNMQKLLTGEYTAEQAAQHIDEECNAAIEEGYASSHLHE